jgi:nucleotide-binding universal stress UspA family protein
MFQRILVALEPSTANAILPQAIDLARTNQAQLRLLHVFSLLDEGYLGTFYPGVEALYPSLQGSVLTSYTEANDRAEARDLVWLEQLVQRALDAGVPTDMQQLRGEPGEAICDAAKDWRADLILVGRRGRSGLSEFLLGSVSNHVMHHAPCSVLTVQGGVGVSDRQPAMAEAV